MKSDEFNAKWKPFLEDRFEGMETDHEGVNNYLDAEFEKEVKVNPNFNFAQIKWKFGTIRVYAESDKTNEWEAYINDNFKEGEQWKQS